MMKRLLLCWMCCLALVCYGQRKVMALSGDWLFWEGDDSLAAATDYIPQQWRNVTVPHDWSIEHDFDAKAPATNLGGALPGGIGWYRKTIILPSSEKEKEAWIEFDGVYKNCSVFINGTLIGTHHYGYTGFHWNITPYVKFGEANVIAVRVDNSRQPDSRWYSGSGIYRNARLVLLNKTSIPLHSMFITTPSVTGNQADVAVRHSISNADNAPAEISVVCEVIATNGKKIVTGKVQTQTIAAGASVQIDHRLMVPQPQLWSPETPVLYKMVVTVWSNGRLADIQATPFGIRTVGVNGSNGFLLNNKKYFLKGVCMHHDLGALGAAVNKSAMKRQLTILKKMGCNAIRLSHNPPAPEFLDLCDEMGFVVIDEAFDMWRKKKTKYDYHDWFEKDHEADLRSMMVRDRNHPSVAMWSIGNEIREQFDSSGIYIAQQLALIARSIDNTRPLISALTETDPAKNFIYQSGALDVLGFNYKDYDYPELPKRFPGAAFIATETASALSTRGVYNGVADSMHVWPPDYRSQDNFTKGYSNFTCNAYDNTYAYWGNTHERSWLAVKNNPHIGGIFVWSGFDYIGEPTPYPFPARSSYFGIIDLAGFPKDVYYMYQSEWTNKPVLHVMPHWSNTGKDSVDVWAYYSGADEVELFLNDRSLGVRRKTKNAAHVQWKVAYQPGVLTAVSRKQGKIILRQRIATAGTTTDIKLVATQYPTNAGNDLVFVTATLTDQFGNTVTEADEMISFTVIDGEVVGTDNGYQADTTSLKKSVRSTWKGKLLAMIAPGPQKRNITVMATTARGVRKEIIVKLQ